jgi:putative transposase
MISFKRRQFKKVIILMAMRGYLSYALSYRNIEELMAERGVDVDHSTVNRWVINYAPKLEAKFSNAHKKKVGSSWRMDEAYIKVNGKWFYLYRAVDKSGTNSATLKTINEGLTEPNKIEIRQIKCLNNIVEQDLRFIKRITKPVMGFKSFQSACAILDGFELCHMLHKNQHSSAANTPVFEQFYALAA